MPDERNGEPELIRGVGLAGATTLNMIDMIGVGPFITMPLIIAAMGGPQAMLGWILGAVLVMCDGLVWAELGASMPHSGGPYSYLKEIYGPRRTRPSDVVSFHLAADVFRTALDRVGGIGLSQYSTYIWPANGLAHKGRGTRDRYGRDKLVADHSHGDRRSGGRSVFALPANHDHRKIRQIPLGRRCRRRSSG